MDSIKTGISNIPHTRLNKVGFRTTTSSDTHNDNQDKILEDILDLYNKSNNIEKKLTQALYVSNCENKYLQSKVLELQQKLDNIKSTTNNGDIKTLNIYPNEIRTPRVYPAKVDNVSSDITITPIISSSKVRIEDSDMDNIFIPPSLNVKLSELKLDGIKSVEDSDVNYAFDGKKDSVWLRRVVTTNSVSSVTTTMTITLPEDVVTTYNINEIKICPFPVSSVDILSIKYRMSNGSWKLVPGFNTHTSVKNGVVKSAPNVKFSFSDIVANQIQIEFKQSKHITENGQRVFYLGCSDIDIRSNTYTGNANHIEFDINIPNDIITPVITDIAAVYNNPNEILGNAIQYEFFYYGDDSLLHKIRDSIPFTSPSHNIIAKCKIFNGKSTPNIANFKINYKDS